MTFEFDVFLSHNSKDKPAVLALRDELVARGLKVWIDVDQLRPGIPWQKLLEDGIRTSGAVVVAVGADGIGPWEDEEMQAALVLAVRDKRPVIPTLLPSAPDKPEWPMFLGNRTWVDFRSGTTPEQLEHLVWGITGKKPGSNSHPTPRPPSRSGTLNCVPPLPLHWVPRPTEMEALKDLVLRSSSTKVGVVSQTQVQGRLGLHGMGGIGKTALAVAFARDPEVAQHFVDGIYWITIGQSCDDARLRELQADLAKRLGSVDETFHNVGQGRVRLSELLKNKIALVIVDDAWEPVQCNAFNAVDPPGALLLTTRNRNILSNFAIRAHSLGLLTPKQARQVLASWAGHAPDDLPATDSSVIDAILAHCNGHALALKLAGAQVLHGIPWQDVATALEEDDFDFLTHPDWKEYGSVISALGASVSVLDPNDRQAYLDLACFPEDQLVPTALVAAYWGIDDRAARKRLGQFAGRALLTSDSGLGFSFHDIQHAYLQKAIASNMGQLHQKLVEACERQFGQSPQDSAVAAYMQKYAFWHRTQTKGSNPIETLLLSSSGVSGWGAVFHEAWERLSPTSYAIGQRVLEIPSVRGGIRRSSKIWYSLPVAVRIGVLGCAMIGVISTLYFSYRNGELNRVRANADAADRAASHPNSQVGPITTPTLSPTTPGRPGWASAYGVNDDSLATWADLTVNGVTQRMRWIPRGTFKMGSPTGEPERDKDELLHEVAITTGFWMADTECTQGFWQAVMGTNPVAVNMHGTELPVCSVSWDDCQVFLSKLPPLSENFVWDLPTDAQWEYACRAGTDTPFSFGANITTDQVNYDGNFPYAGASKGTYRGSTTPVKTFSANGWGIFDMHGNLFEWCCDRYGPYGATRENDPTGPVTGDSRVVRGGSWNVSAWFCRSALRFRSAQGLRDTDLGFRFIQVQKKG